MTTSYKKETNRLLEENATNDLADLPLHDGATKYYKKTGVLD